MRLVVNARFRQRPTTGVERMALEIVSRLATPTVEARPSTWSSRGIGGHLWEQSVLPMSHRRDLIWSPCNVGPLAAKHHVVTVHDTAVLSHPEWFSGPFAWWYQRLLPRLVGRATHVVTVSDHVRRDLIDRMALEPERVSVIANGVSTSFAPAEPAEVADLRARLAISGPYLLVLGSLDPRKNLNRVLDAWRIAGRDLTDHQLVVAGGADDRVFARDRSERSVGRIRLVGRVDERDLAPLYSGADALIYASMYEGFGLPPLEAMACGTSVVLGDTDGLRSTFGRSCTYVDPYSVEAIAAAMVEVVRIPASFESMAATVAQYGWDRAAQRYDELFQRLIPGP